MGSVKIRTVMFNLLNQKKKKCFKTYLLTACLLHAGNEEKFNVVDASKMRMEVRRSNS